MFNTMTAFSAHRFKIIGFDMLIMSCRVILPKRSSDTYEELKVK